VVASPARVVLAPSVLAAAEARRCITERLVEAGLDDLVDDAALAVTELVSNVVLHTRSAATVWVDVTPDSARVHVHDDADLPPVRGLLDELAISGRGLLMVERLTQQWGVTRVPDGGKIVWFELIRDAARPLGDLTADDLLDMWDDSDPVLDDVAASRPAGSCHIELPAVATATLVATKTHIEDLVRDLTLLIAGSQRALDHGPGVDRPGLVELAARVNALAAEVADLRHALHCTALHALHADLPDVVIVLDLDPALAASVEAYRDALDEADVHCHAGALLVEDSPSSTSARFRRLYLTAIAEQLRACERAGADTDSSQ
jgi:anti-sigma regulatory factor (Ser/Thr protein kinase)